ncbi:MAG TPA: DUF2934 domain-containing protein [Burkholderiales bacterium]|nr:DUF2934 domain-containing protein [Burkholderiales bacterium]
MGKDKPANTSGSGQGKTRAGAKAGTAKPGKSRRASGILHPTDRDPRTEFNDEEWHDMVATAAYQIAEARGFAGGSSDEDWYEAEARLREQFASAEDEADEKAESALDLASHRTPDRSGRGK